MFAGNAAVAAPIDHSKLDLAVIRVSASVLDGECETGTSPPALSAKANIFRRGSSLRQDIPQALSCTYPAPSNRNTTTCSSDCWRVMAAPSDLRQVFRPNSWVTAGPQPGQCVTTRPRSTAIPARPFCCLGRPGAQQDVALTGLHYGGDWGGERTNWAHRLSAAGGAVGYGQTKTFAEFCRGGRDFVVALRKRRAPVGWRPSAWLALKSVSSLR